MRNDRTEQLEKFHAKNESHWLRDRRAKIPGVILDRTATAAKIALTIKKGNHRNSPSDAEHRAIGKEIEGLSDAERLALFKAVFPKLASALDRAWRDLARRAVFIETNYWCARVPFRAGRARRHLTFTRGVWFTDVVGALVGYDPDPEWLAAWITHIGGYDCHVAAVLAGAIDIGDKTSDRVFEILKASATNTHPVGEMSINVIAALLMSERPAAWEFVADLLLNGKREEGLRQAILESIHECHPDAFVRFLHLIMEERLVRFSSVVRAADVWFGLRWDSIGPAVIQKQVERAYLYLTNDGARDKALASGSGEEAYMALWCVAFRDLDAAAKRAAQLVMDTNPERRFAAVAISQMACAPEFMQVILAGLKDADERVVAGAVRAVERAAPIGAPDSFKTEALFDALARVLDRVAAARPRKLEPIIWPWTAETLSTAFVGGPLVRVAPASRKDDLVPRLDKLGPKERREVALGIGLAQSLRQATESKPGKPGPLKPEGQAALISLLGDASAEARDAAFRGLSPHPLTPAERDRIEYLLARKASDIRTKGIERLLTQSDEDALASARRLLGLKSVEQHLAGAEILAQMMGKKRSVDRVAAEARRASDALAGSTKNKKPDARVESLLATARKGHIVVPTLRDCLGLVPPDRVLIPPDSVPKPRAFEPLVMTREAIEMLMSLERLMQANRDLPISGSRDLEDPSQDMVLGGAYPYQLWNPGDGEDRRSQWTSYRTADGSLDLGEMQHAELWLGWWNSQATACGETATRVLLLAWLIDVYIDCGGWGDRGKWRSSIKAILPTPAPRAPLPLAAHIIRWLMFRLLESPTVDTLLHQAEGAIARGSFIDRIPGNESDRRTCPKSTAIELPFESWARYIHTLIPALPGDSAAAARIRLYRLYRMVDAAWPDYYLRVLRGPLEEIRAKSRNQRGHSWSSHPTGNMPRPNLVEFVAAANANEADEIDFFRLAVQEHEGEEWRDHIMHRWSIGPHLSGRYHCQVVIDGLKKIRERAAEIEITRGDAITAATPVVEELELFEGASIALRAIAALKGRSLKRGYLYGTDRSTSLCRLIVYSLPASEDTDASFSQLVRQHDLSETRLVELALYAPQWAGHVERHLGWVGLEDASWWIHAHAKNSESQMSYANEVRTVWRSRVAERTVVDREDFKDGAVDRAWFLRIYKALGEKRWNQVYALAKAAAAGANHKRAQVFADAILGRTKSADLKKAIATKRTQDAVRALGLVPLPSGDAGRRELKDRYLVMQEMRRTSRKHGGSMLQASEKRAVEIGLDNLARTAGYTDPQRLQWAMEIEASGDLSDGLLTKKVGDITVTLSIDETGGVSVACEKKGKRLASIPAASKKSPEIAELLERSRELKKQKSRVRQSLEAAMCRGDLFSGAELRSLCAHPVLRPMLERLVLVGDSRLPRLGYAESGATRLRGRDGKTTALPEKESFRIAHPHDLLESGDWSALQRECFASERIQPFKQIFRELYVPTPAEKKGRAESTRYAGHQVQPRQAIALLGSRGWVVRPDDGVQRTFHHQRVRAFLSFDEHFYTPAEVEGLTVQSVTFRPLGSYDPIKLRDVPPRVFSEVMRDVDLAVSVAHRGGRRPGGERVDTRDPRRTRARDLLAAEAWQRQNQERPRDHHRRACRLQRPSRKRRRPHAPRRLHRSRRRGCPTPGPALSPVCRRRPKDRRNPQQDPAFRARWGDQGPVHPGADTLQLKDPKKVTPAGFEPACPP